MSGAASAASDDDEALTVVLRQSIEELSRYYAKPKAICLSAAKPDWAARVVAKGDFPLLRESAACPTVEASSRQTDNVSLWLGDITHLSPNELTIKRWVYRHPLDASEGVFTLHRDRGQWTVSKYVQNWVS